MNSNDFNPSAGDSTLDCVAALVSALLMPILTVVALVVL